MGEKSGLILLVSTGGSYLMHSLVEKMQARRIRVISVGANAEEISMVKEKADAILIYDVDKEPIDQEVIVMLRDKAITEDCQIILMGDKIFFDTIRKFVLPNYINSVFLHPINVDNVAVHMAEYMESRFYAEKKKILVVDDSAEMLKKIKLWLSSKYHVIVAKSGAMAVKYLAMEKPDLILLDYEMPVLNGKQVLEMIRAEEDFRMIPIIFLTACNDKDVIMDIAKLKPEGYLLKTMEPSKIIGEIDSFFNKR